MARPYTSTSNNWIMDATPETTLIVCRRCGWRTMSTSPQVAKRTANAHRHPGQDPFGRVGTDG